MANQVPVYIQIHDQLKDEIEKGLWKVGDRLPSERELSVKFSVSRMTLRQAIQTLADEGILERKIGSGTYVANEKVQEKMSGTTSFTDIMESQNKVPSSKTISFFYSPASSSEIQNLALEKGEQILRMERIRYADDIPICFEVASIPAKLVKGFSREEITDSFYHTLKEKGMEIGRANQTVSAILASEQIADYLEMKRGDAILRLRQISYLEDGQPFEYVRTQYVGNRFEFYLEK
ncbi:GntR family transcriptional regulator [Enterococcus florum]|uniref:GntR family transcriptional regulator n=1 Tax=Enterococcus florum TaxID=2480627 RepID=A0A4P5PAX3_9ENTE|nr:GntR family transcriptional regulator [Enterococcus florum]GCF93411.1 GntR family transcriptional regulator [Enterococcus florum]